MQFTPETNKQPPISCSDILSVPQRDSHCCEVPLLYCIRLSFPLWICSFLLILTLLYLLFNFPPLYIHHSLYLCLLSLCLYWFCGSARSMLLAHFDRGSEMESQAAKWNQSLLFPPPSLFSLVPPQEAQTSLALNLCVWNELSMLWLSARLCPLSLVLCSLSRFFFFLTSQIHFSLTLIACVTVKD